MKHALSVCLALSLAACGASTTTTTAEMIESSTTRIATTATPEPTVRTTTTEASPPTSTTSTTWATSTTTSSPSGTDVVLEADGLGVVEFGQPSDQVIEELAARLGPPTVSEQVEPDTPTRTELRVFWQNEGLRIGFSTYPFFRDDGELHFTWWGTWTEIPPANPLKTAAGVGTGSTMTEVLAAYGDHFFLNTDVCGPPAFIAPIGAGPGEPRDDEGRPQWIQVYFDGGTNNPDSTAVSGMYAGADDGC